jgi:histidyl-tRNA synthetase
MEKMGLVKQEGSVAKVILLNFDPRCALYLEEVATNLRRSGIATEIYFGPETTLKGQLSYAVKQSVPFVLIAGSKELERGVVQLKDLAAREQVEVPRTDIAEILSARLSGG